MKGYLLFAWDDEDGGGWSDFKGSFEKQQEAEATANSKVVKGLAFRNWEIVHRDTEKVVLEGWLRPRYDPDATGKIEWGEPLNG